MCVKQNGRIRAAGHTFHIIARHRRSGDRSFTRVDAMVLLHLCLFLVVPHIWAMVRRLGSLHSPIAANFAVRFTIGFPAMFPPFSSISPSPYRIPTIGNSIFYRKRMLTAQSLELSFRFLRIDPPG